MFSNIDTCSKSPIPTFSFHIFHLLSYLSSSNLFYHTYYFFTLSIPLLPFRVFLTYFLPFHSYSFLPSLPFFFLLTFLSLSSSYLPLLPFLFLLTVHTFLFLLTILILPPHFYLSYLSCSSLPFFSYLPELSSSFLPFLHFLFLLTFLTCPLLPFYLSYISSSALPFLLP